MKGKISSSNATKPPYSSRGYDNAGVVHGVGVPAKVGIKDGGFTDIKARRDKIPKSPPPRKMN